MKKRIKAIIVAVTLFAALMPAAGAYAWEVEYNASTGLLPTADSSAWRLDTNNGVSPAVSDGALRILGLDTFNSYTYYYGAEGSVDAGVPVTVEARMRTAGASTGAPVLAIETEGCYAKLFIYSDHLAAVDYATGSWATFSGDFTTLRTIRLAYNGGNRAYAWVDGQNAISFETGGSGQSNVSFGSAWSGEFDSYWESVAYSKEFLPVPEPSSLLLLGCPCIGLALSSARSKKRSGNR